MAGVGASVLLQGGPAWIARGVSLACRRAPLLLARAEAWRMGPGVARQLWAGSWEAAVAGGAEGGGGAAQRGGGGGGRVGWG